MTMRRLLIAIACGSTLVGCGTSEKIISEHWAGPTSTPSGQEYTPRGSIGMSGDVILSCVLAPAGRLTQCAVEKEDPPGWDFGAAALRMSQHMVIKSDLPVGSTVRVPIAFKPHGLK